MILSGLKIKSELKKGNININPFDDEMLNPNSYNYRLGDELLEITDKIIDPKMKTNYKVIKLTTKGYILKPHKLYLGCTVESIGSKKYVTQLIGRSSMGRLGLFLQVTAPLGHVGCNHCWTLELKTVQPLRVYPNMKIGQVTFWRLKGKTQCTYETGKYNNYTKPHISMFYKNGGIK
ncbi:MAG: dCTP deaminase [Clostridia bacterium]